MTCSYVQAMEQTEHMSSAAPASTGTSGVDDLHLALALADIGADLASETRGSEAAELRRQIDRLRERARCPRVRSTP